MDVTHISGASVQYANPWKLQDQRNNHCLYHNAPHRNGNMGDIASSLSEDMKEKLREVDIRSIDPAELSNLTWELHRDGYLSHDAWSQLGEFQLDYTGLVDPLEETRDALKTIRGKDDVKYSLCIRNYETAIDAVEGLEKLINYLNGRMIDVYA